MSLPPFPKHGDYRERLRWSLARVESWIGNADTKATIVLGLDGVLAAALFGLHGSFQRNAQGIALAIISAGALLWSAAWATLAIFPDITTSRREEENETSIYHFATVASENAESFRSTFRGMSDEDDLHELEHQVYVNSAIATRKFRRLRCSIWGILALLVIVVGLGAYGLLAAPHGTVGVRR